MFIPCLLKPIIQAVLFTEDQQSEIDYEPDCASYRETHEFFSEYSPKIQFITTTNYVDYENAETPLQQSMNAIFPDAIDLSLNSRTHSFVHLAQNRLEVSDDMFDPFSGVTNAWDFLTIKEASVNPTVDFKALISG